jgi:hypothetical protein
LLSSEEAFDNHTLITHAAAAVGAAVPLIHAAQLLYAPEHPQV